MKLPFSKPEPTKLVIEATALIWNAPVDLSDGTEFVTKHVPEIRAPGNTGWVVNGVDTSAVLSDARIPMLWSHSNGDPVGYWTGLVVNEARLIARGEIHLVSRYTRDRAAEVHAGVVAGVSIGFDTLDYERTQKGKFVRQLELHEISLAAVPACHSCYVQKTEYK